MTDQRSGEFSDAGQGYAKTLSWPALIRECIENDTWMYLNGEFIEHDGE